MKENGDNNLGELIEKYKAAGNRLLLLDFDGTLVHLQLNPDDAIPSAQLSELLTKLGNDPRNKLVVITGRHKDDIDKRLDHLPIDIIAEHGAMIKENANWRALLGSRVDWKNQILPVIRKYVEDCADSYLEEKAYSIAWQYRRVEKQKGIKYSRKLIEELTKLALIDDLKILDGKLAVEVTCKSINKGLATDYLLRNKNFDCILSIGDDAPDEDMFEVLINNDKAYTVKIGKERSFAKHRLDNIEQAISLLEKLLVC